MTAKLHNRQTIMDVAVQHCGSADDYIQVALLNGLSITDDVDFGTELIIPGVSNQKTVSYLKAFGNVPISQIDIPPVEPEGIGYWIIEDTFIVQ